MSTHAYIPFFPFLLTLAPFVNLAVDTFPVSGDSLRISLFLICDNSHVIPFIKRISLLPPFENDWHYARHGEALISPMKKQPALIYTGCFVFLYLSVSLFQQGVSMPMTSDVNVSAPPLKWAVAFFTYLNPI